MGLRTRVPQIAERELETDTDRLQVIQQAAEDKSAMVRSRALDAVIRYELVSDEAHVIASSLVGDRSRAVRERAAYILEHSSKAEHGKRLSNPSQLS
jgi:hypothetical protein